MSHLQDETDEDKYKNFEPLPLITDEEYRIKAKKNGTINNSSTFVFVANEPVRLLSVTAERQSIQHLIYPYIYTISLSHNHVKWEVQRNYRELKDMHKQLTKLVKAEYGVRCSEIPSEEIKPDWPLFPIKHDGLVTEDEILYRCNCISSYLSKILKCQVFRDHPALLQLLAVSRLSFQREYSKSIIEDMLTKRETQIFSNFSCRASRLCCNLFKLCYGKRWVCVKDTFIVYMNPKYNNAIGYVILVDSDFKCKIKSKWNAYNGLEISNQQRKLFIRFQNYSKQDEWYQAILHLSESEPAKLFIDPRYLTYDSYAPARPKQLCRWIMNASFYMKYVSNALNNAKHEIFITDWWLTPELYLIRPTDDLKYRLDKILLEKAKQGVKIYILLYKEITFVQNLMSLRARDILTENGKNPNIKVLRHPGQFLFMDNVFLWSHHEKCVIVDQSIAFMGGIDLCFGRYDDDAHRLIDLGEKENITDIIPPLVKKIKSSKSDSNLFKINRSVMNTSLLASLTSHHNHSLSTISITDIASPTFSEPIQKPASKPPTVVVALPKFERTGTKIEMAFSNTNPRKNGQSEKEKLENQQKNNHPERSDSRIAQAFSRAPKLDHKPTTRKPPVVAFVMNETGFVQMETTKTPEGAAAQSIKTNPKPWSNKKYSANEFSRIPRFKAVGNQIKSDIKDHIHKSKEKDKDPSNQNIKWVTSKKEILDRQKKTTSILSHLAMKTRQKSTLEDDLLPRDEKYFSDNLGFEDLDLVLPKNSQSGYYYWIGKDYSNVYYEDFKDIDVHSIDQFSREEVPRMPWRDQAMVMLNESARDLARHFIQRWNQTKNEQCPDLEAYPYLMPNSYSEAIDYDCRPWMKEELFECNVQITRSADDWSVGIKKTEHSILNAYLDLIKKAEHFIYIENQFFITTTNPAKDDVKNTIGLALAERIIRAHQANQSFKVYVFLPLLPGFDKMNAIKAVQYYNLRSIKFGQYSIYNMLQKNGVSDPTKYITFHGMRNWTVLMGKLVQEIIYVHSKLMIVDDKYVITGSANINDRSMLGKRDSELAAVVKDESFVDSTLNGRSVKVGKYASTLRQKIFKIHLGIAQSNPARIDVSDCAADSFYQMFRNISHQNSLVFEQVFKCIPSDNLLTFKSVQNNHKQACLKNTDPVEGKLRLEKVVKGFLVDFPLLFLSKEKNFFPDFHTAEGIVPHELWT